MYSFWGMVRDRRTDGRQKKWHIEISVPPKKGTWLNKLKTYRKTNKHWHKQEKKILLLAKYSWNPPSFKEVGVEFPKFSKKREITIFLKKGRDR